MKCQDGEKLVVLLVHLSLYMVCPELPLTRLWMLCFADEAGNVMHKSPPNASDKSRLIYTFHMIEGQGAKYDEKNW
jgi:hypothetical protein